MLAEPALDLVGVDSAVARTVTAERRLLTVGPGANQALAPAAPVAAAATLDCRSRRMDLAVLGKRLVEATATINAAAGMVFAETRICTVAPVASLALESVADGERV